MPSLQGWFFTNMKEIKMSKNVKQNVIWVDFKTKRIFDLASLGHPKVSKQPIPYLCQINQSMISNGRIK
jgi:hypothetical protein